MSAYVNPASIRVDVSDLLILRDEAIRAAKESLPEAGNDFTQACNGVAVAAVVDMLCDGWKTTDDLLESFTRHVELVNEEVL